jgi:hypothetical protein
MRRPGRAFHLSDALVLLAATGAGLAWVRAVGYLSDFEGVAGWLEVAPDMAALFLLTWTLAVGGLRLLPPRPPLPRLALQPGAAACGAVALVFSFESFSYLVHIIAGNRGLPWALLRDGGMAAELYLYAVSGGPYHYPVAAVWGLLILSRRCRPEPSWVDRAGRALGLCWLLLPLWWLSTSALREWQAAGG